MQFHFEKTLEKRYEPQVTVTNETPAWLMICLAESIKDWIGQSPRIFCKSEEPYLQFGYEVLTFPVAEFAQIFGPLIYAINQAWCGATSFLRNSDKIYEKKRNASQAPGRRFWPSAAARTRTRSWRPLWTRWWPPGSLIVRSVGWRWTTRPTPCDCYCSKWGGM